MRLLRYQDLPTTPWKNGGGVTREVISLSDCGSSADFLWRVSIATVAASGPFSRFPNIDRTIAVLSGHGIRLSDQDGTKVLMPVEAPYSFAGETSIDASIIDGETTDLNAMSLRDAFRHTMETHLAYPEASVTTTADHTIIVVGGPMDIACNGEHVSASAFASLVDLRPGTALTLRAPEPTRYYVIGFHSLMVSTLPPSRENAR